MVLLHARPTVLLCCRLLNFFTLSIPDFVSHLPRDTSLSYAVNKVIMHAGVGQQRNIVHCWTTLKQCKQSVTRARMQHFACDTHVDCSPPPPLTLPLAAQAGSAAVALQCSTAAIAVHLGKTAATVRSPVLCWWPRTTIQQALPAERNSMRASIAANRSGLFVVHLCHSSTRYHNLLYRQFWPYLPLCVSTLAR